jgi:Mrp family chromosome partitioning ATPase
MSRLEHAFVRAFEKRRAGGSGPHPVTPAPHFDVATVVPATPAAARSIPALDPEAPILARAMTVDAPPFAELPVRPLATPLDPASLDELPPAPEFSTPVALPAPEALLPAPDAKPARTERLWHAHAAHVLAGPHVADEPGVADVAPGVGPARPSSRSASTRLRLRPQFETPRFHWPVSVESLVRRAGDALHTAARGLATEATRGRNTLLVTGCRPREGRTTVLLSAAHYLTEFGARVVLVDANFQSPQLADELGIEAEAGWEDVLDGDLPIHEALIESTADGTALLPLVHPIERLGVARRLEAVERTLAALHESFDFVAIDGGVLGAEAGPEAWLAAAGRPVDRAWIVYDRDRTAWHEVTSAAGRLRDVGLPHWDAVENFAS